MLRLPSRLSENEQQRIRSTISRYSIDDDYLSFAPLLPKAGLGFRYVSAPITTKDNSEAKLEFVTEEDLMVYAVGTLSWLALFLHTFLLQYRKSGAVLPVLPKTCYVTWQEAENGFWRSHTPEPGQTAALIEQLKAQHCAVVIGGEFDETWKLRLLLKPVNTRAQLLERLGEANVIARQVYGEQYFRRFIGDYISLVSFGEQSYAKHQAYLKHYGMPPAPAEAPVDSHESIIAWLSSRMRDENSDNHSSIFEGWCKYCLIDRRDGSWSIYGWNDGDGIGRYPPEELVRYYDEAMAYEYLLNAALDAVVTY